WIRATGPRPAAGLLHHREAGRATVRGLGCTLHRLSSDLDLAEVLAGVHHDRRQQEPEGLLGPAVQRRTDRPVLEVRRFPVDRRATLCVALEVGLPLEL